jgi:hypothetical protein
MALIYYNDLSVAQQGLPATNFTSKLDENAEKASDLLSFSM